MEVGIGGCGRTFGDRTLWLLRCRCCFEAFNIVAHGRSYGCAKHRGRLSRIDDVWFAHRQVSYTVRQTGISGRHKHP